MTLNIEEFVNTCLMKSNWPPTNQGLPDALLINDPILQAMIGLFRRSEQERSEFGCGIDFENSSNSLVMGEPVKGKCSSIVIKPVIGRGERSPIGTFHTHYEHEGPFRGVSQPPSMADILEMARPGNFITLVMAGASNNPVYYLIIATREFLEHHEGGSHRVGKSGFSKQELEHASEEYISTAQRERFDETKDLQGSMQFALEKDFHSTLGMLNFAAYKGHGSELRRIGLTQ